MDHQDWKPVKLEGGPAHREKIKNMKEGQTRISKLPSKHFRNVDADDPEGFKHPKTSVRMGRQISNARVAKKMNQKKLAEMMNVPVKIIQEYENSKAIPSGNIINKFNRILGIKLIRDDK
jgi:ribosome-binding protein aMBF1 (putative translation factor)